MNRFTDLRVWVRHEALTYVYGWPPRLGLHAWLIWHWKGVQSMMTRTNDRTVYDSEGQIVCRPIIPLGPPEETKNTSEKRPTLRGIAVTHFIRPESER